ncbi:substrate-binding domain-containing protein [Sagittula sp. MA-2]|jgi:ribose transport system substrate-binding protein|uniref:substrate-binding domain-containing protein n=1 Tax=Sagittula sp. MA-2 TaxID=3048007 RepID=UPI0024C275E1|nr:substrate-binding domain-containing protein [Sagittula sp. MA-2]WHZ33351.1 substrate-binding domain-containing protein [Sagittula sp. MA-2]
MRLLLTATGILALSLAPAHAQNFDDPEEFAKQREQLQATPSGPEDQPWLQYIGDSMVETADLGLEAPATVCFSNAGVNNPWRVVGFTNMNQELLNHESIGDFVHVDAEGSDDKQIADIDDLLAGGNCDVMIVSPNTTAALTPAVERACEAMPVIVFDRGVNTDCPVTFIHPVGGYGFGIQGAEFVASQLEEAGMNIVGAEFTDGDNAKTKSIVEDYLMRGNIDAVWMDAGATAVAAIEAFEDSGYEIPVFVGEDQQDFLRKWQDEGMKAIAPTYPTFQWRTAIIAAARVIEGEALPGPEWVLPQPAITEENLSEYVNPAMPPLHYAMCGCESMENYPEAWGGE